MTRESRDESAAGSHPTGELHLGHTATLQYV